MQQGRAVVSQSIVVFRERDNNPVSAAGACLPHHANVQYEVSDYLWMGGCYLDSISASLKGRFQSGNALIAPALHHYSAAHTFAFEKVEVWFPFRCDLGNHRSRFIDIEREVPRIVGAVVRPVRGHAIGIPSVSQQYRVCHRERLGAVGDVFGRAERQAERIEVILPYTAHS